MRYCNTCNNIYTNCCCESTVVSSTIINSDQAGRDGLSAKDIYINTGKIPPNATDNQFAEAIKGDKGDKGDRGLTGTDGTDGDTYIPVNENNFFNI